MDGGSRLPQLAAVFVLGFFLGVGLCALYFRHNNSVMYDPTILAHVHENIVNAEQIRRGEEDQVLSRIDAWLRGPDITKSIDGFITSEETKKKAMESIEGYREKYDPVKSSGNEAAELDNR